MFRLPSVAYHGQRSPIMRILVTAGPTREFFDSVRFISNASSGKMGLGIAVEAARRGHRVDLVVGPVQWVAPKGVKTHRVVSAEEMFDACTATFPKCDAAIMTAAVCDYRPARRSKRKIKKTGRSRAVELRPTKDICATLGRTKGHRIVIGFALEDHDPRRRAEQKLRRKRCDAIVLNHVDTLGASSARVEILRADTGWLRPQAGSKARIAKAVVDLLEALAAPNL